MHLRCLQLNSFALCREPGRLLGYYHPVVVAGRVIPPPFYTAQLSSSESSDEFNSSRKGVISSTLTAITLVIPVSITRCAKPHIHGIQQHPHRHSTATATIMALNIEVSNPLHFPNHFSIIVEWIVYF